MFSKSFVLFSTLVFGTLVSTSFADDVTGVTHDPLCPYPSDVITFFPFPGDCTKYIECYEGTKYYMHCGYNLYWNQASQTCDYECNTSEVPDDGSTTTPHGNLDPDCPETGTYYYPHYSNCRKFFQCKDGYKIVLNCVEGYAFSTVLNTCDLIEQVDCSYTTELPTVTPTPSPDSCPASGISYLPNYYDCTKFYECNDGEKIEMECQEDYAWSIEKHTCDKIENVDCSHITGWTDATTPGGDDSCPSTGLHYFPHDNDCTKFYKCKNGDKTVLTCPEGYSWSIKLNACDNTEDVDCSYVSTTSASPDTTTSDSSNLCDGQPNGTLLPHPTDPHKYIDCVEGKEVIMDCPGDTVFDPNLNVCD